MIVFRRYLLHAPVLLSMLLAPAALWPYAHFLYEAESGGPFQARAFELAALPDSTVRFFVSPRRPVLRSNDTYAGLISQIRAALAVWDAVPTSALRVEFRGIRESPSEDSAPYGEILFAELPPGVLGLGGPMTQSDGGRGPIVRSQVFLSSDLTTFATPRPSYSEGFFNSLVHEIGHALGLQHSLAGSAMSTEPTRATTRAQPLDVDDVAGISALYPSADFARTTGVIDGRVMYRNGEPVALASVIALAPIGGAVTALTGADGQFRMEGVPPGRYWLAVQPLPPSTQEGLGPANLVLPRRADGSSVVASGPFSGQFYEWSQPGKPPDVVVQAGERVPMLFSVARRSEIPLHTVTTFSFPGNGAPGVHPAFATLSDPAPFLLAVGRGNNEALPRSEVSVLGGDVEMEHAAPYAFDARFSRLNIVANRLSRLGPRHMVFRRGDDTYILPAAFRLTRNRAPVLFWAQPSGSGLATTLWTVRGTDLSEQSRVFFDGFEASVVGYDRTFGELTVSAPPAPAGHRAVVTALNPDGQSSAMTLPDGNVMAELAGLPPAQYSVFGGPLLVGGDTLLEIEASEPVFADGATWMGFESADLRVREIVVESRRRMLAVVSAGEAAGPGPHKALLVNGLRVEEAAGIGAERVETAMVDSRARIAYEGLVNDATGLPRVAPGSLASLYGAGFPGGNVAVRVSFNGIATTGASVTESQIHVAVPAELSPGTVRLRVEGDGWQSHQMLATLEAAAPGVFYALDNAGQAVSADNPARPGEEIVLIATGLPRSAAADSVAENLRVAVLVGSTRSPVLGLNRAVGTGLVAVRFRMPDGVSGAVSVAIWADGQTSNRITLPLTSE